MIDFTRAFESAWERMLVILFRPFDPGKWLAIGLGAFLAGLLGGGNGFTSPNTSYDSYSKYTNNPTPKFDLHWFNDHFSSATAGLQTGAIILFSLVFGVIALAVVLLIYWLGSRGQFIFLDNVVRNRGAVTTPWTYYARLANSLFGFYVLVMAISLVVFLPMAAVGIVMGLPLFQQHRWPEGAEIGGFAVLGLIYFVLAVAVTIILFLFREFGIPLMFRQGLLARPAFVATLNVARRHAGSVAVFLLLRVAILLAVLIVSVIVCCGTCCIEMVPYVGTVLLLPALVYVKCFTLDCLAQFGPEYNVWTVDVPPAGLGPVPTFNPPPPLG